MDSAHKARILQELTKLTAPEDFAEIATMIDAGQGWFEVANPVNVWTAPGESDYDTLVTAVTETTQPDILRSLVEFFDAQQRTSSSMAAEPRAIYGLSPEQSAELQRRLELDRKDIGPYISGEDFLHMLDEKLAELS